MQKSTCKKIMLIDDSITIRMSTSKMLKNEGHEVFLAEEGFEAISNLASVQPDVIFLDLSMPNWSGFEVLALLKTHRDFCEIPVIILSGKDGLSDRAKAYALGANDFLIKPCAKEDLARSLSAIP